jgi:hypothetical protein
MMAAPEALELLAFVRRAAEREGGAVEDDGPAAAPPTPSDAAGFASLAGHALTIRFANAAGARAFLAAAGTTILELLEWSSIAVIVHVGERRLSLRDGIEEADEELQALGGGGG